MLEEDIQNYDNIFILLAMIYDPQNIKLVKENIVNGTSESITFAVEMLDIFIEEELKPKVLPVMDELKLQERLSKLQNFYPPEDFDSYEDLLLQIINRDFNRINRYTKALAMYRFSQLSTHVTADLIANLFHRDHLLLQTSASVIYNMDEEAYHKHTKRLKPSIKKELDKEILPPVFKNEGEGYHQKMLLIDRILFLKENEMFKQLSGELITYLAEVLEEIKVGASTTLLKSGSNGLSPLHIVIEGKVKIQRADGSQTTKSSGFVFGERYINEADHFDYTVTARETTTLLVLKKEELLNLMSKHLEFLEWWIDIMYGEEQHHDVEIVDVLFSN